jgi:hypothetical protein
MDMGLIAGELGAIIAILIMISLELGSIKKHLKGED